MYKSLIYSLFFFLIFQFISSLHFQSFKDMDEANKSLKIVEDRHADILKLEKSIKVH